MKLPERRHSLSGLEELLSAAGFSQEKLALCKLLWFAAAWLPGVLFFPFNWLLEAPMYSIIQSYDEALARRLCWLSSSVVIPLLSLLLALGAYPAGQAHLLQGGLLLQPQRRLDPYTRLYSASTGCSATGLSLLRQLPNNAVAYALRSLAGPPPGAYAGPFPSLAEALGALSTAGSELSLSSYYSESFRLVGGAVQLAPGSARAILQFSGLPDGQIDSVKLALFGDRCLIVGIKHAGKLGCIALADLQTSRPFNVYTVPQLR